MNQYEKTALFHCLLSWNPDWDYQTVLDNIHESQDVVVWGPVAHLEKEEIISAIASVKKHLEKFFNEKTKKEVDNILQKERQAIFEAQSVFSKKAPVFKNDD